MSEAPRSFADVTLEDFTARLASADPIPGGGSASAVAGALGAGLLAMVASLSVDRPRYAAYDATLRRGLEAAQRARVRLLQLADADAEAYSRFGDARRLPRETEDEQAIRADATRAAARAAAEIPLEIVRECAVLAEHVESLAGRSNLNAASDLEVAALILHAAAGGAGANVLINLPAMDDDSHAGALTVEVERYVRGAERAAQRVREQVAQATLRDPEPETEVA